MLHVLFIIFGTKGVTYSKDSGQFFCPQCSMNRSYKLKRVRRFFTLYFIPLIPLDRLAEYVECETCKGTWRPELLAATPGAGGEGADLEAEFQSTVRRVMVMMMLADGAIETEEVEVIQSIFEELSGRGITAEEVATEAAEVRAADETIESYLASAGSYLNTAGKELVVKAALMVAGADQQVDESEKELLGRIADSLQLSQAHFRGIVAEMTQPS